MDLHQMLDELVKSGAIPQPAHDAVPSEPTNFVFVQTCTVYGDGMVLGTQEQQRNAELERRT